MPSYTCFKTPNGPHCCSEFDSLCQECSQNYQTRCDQKCIQFRQEPRCLCDENYVGVANTNNAKCLHNESKMNALIYATENSIRRLDLHTNKSDTIKDGISATCLTSAHGDVYYATFVKGMGYIFKISVASNDTREIISTDSKITSLAIDWITNQTYYSTNSSTIVACSEAGTCIKLKSCNAHSIGLAPRFGLLFWVETKADQSSSQYIMKSSMDGSNETLLTVCNKISWPVTISIDEVHQPTMPSYGDHAVFTTFEKKVYFALHESKQIYVEDIASKLITAPLQMTIANSSFITNLYAYNPKLQRTKIANPCLNSCTGGLCLLRPSSTRKDLNYTCFYDIRKEANESGNNTSGFVVFLIGIVIAIAVWLIFRYKRTLFRNNRITESNTNDIPLQTRVNNELSKDVAECSKLCETEYKKNNNCNKSNKLVDMDYSTSDFKDVNYIG